MSVVLVTLAKITNYVYGQSLTLLYNVSGVTTPRDAEWANDGTTRIPAYGEGWIDGGYIGVNKKTTNKIAPDYWEVQVDYGPRQTITTIGGQNSGEMIPLPAGDDVPMGGISCRVRKIEASFNATYEGPSPFDKSVDGFVSNPDLMNGAHLPICNSVGQPVEGGVPDVAVSWEVTFRKVDKYFNWAWVGKYIQKCNSKPLMLFGRTIPAGHCECISAECDTDIEPWTESVVMVYQFMISQTTLQFYQVRDYGSNGIYLEGGARKTGPFQNGDQPLTDVQLDGTGLPLDKNAGIKVYGSHDPTPGQVKVQSITVGKGAGASVYLLYRRRAMADLSEMHLFDQFAEAKKSAQPPLIRTRR